MRRVRGTAAKGRTLVKPIGQGGGTRWNPSVGPEGSDFFETVVPADSLESVQESSLSILAQGIPPVVTEGQETGLVVGYVQGGKTMSFEAVAALAHDNGFRIIIVVGGTSNPLLDQSTNRLRRDLRLNHPDRLRRWILFQNPSADRLTRQAIRDALDDWRDPNTPEEFKKSVLITVLKHHGRLSSLTHLMSDLDLAGAPVLVVDDEADQASLNTQVSQGLESTTYRRFMELRQALPSHTYLQYTATPQAPLLVSIIDSLSPNFVQVLEPGPAYVGGKDLFTDDRTYVRVIPPHDVATRSNPLYEPPESLLQALQVFMLGVAAALKRSGNIGNRSMLVHPSHLTAQHQEYHNWARTAVGEWKRVLSLPLDDPDRAELIEDFRAAYDDLAGTVGLALPTFSELIDYLPIAFRNTRVLEVNAREGRTPSVDWRGAFGWILVGGQAMDRGFTVEGLTVTYMPRGIGVGNADTVQQRARFFGYKRDYVDYCRVYLEEGTIVAYQAYVEHEEDIRTQLLQFQDSRRPLNEWKRAFVLDPKLRPCRKQVVAFDYMRGGFSDAWFRPRIVLASDSVLEANRRVAEAFTHGIEFVDDFGHVRRTPAQQHHVSKDVPLRAAIERLLVPTRITGTADSQRYTGLLLQLAKALEDSPEEICTVYVMSPATGRSRGIDENGEITNLFQGEAPVDPPELRGTVYPGDSAIRAENHVTVQIHRLDLIGGERQTVARDVPVLAVWVPARLGREWVVQEVR